MLTISKNGSTPLSPAPLLLQANLPAALHWDADALATEGTLEVFEVSEIVCFYEYHKWSVDSVDQHFGKDSMQTFGDFTMGDLVKNFGIKVGEFIQRMI